MLTKKNETKKLTKILKTFKLYLLKTLGFFIQIICVFNIGFSSSMTFDSKQKKNLDTT